jgi:hypothetical protein
MPHLPCRHPIEALALVQELVLHVHATEGALPVVHLQRVHDSTVAYHARHQLHI